MNTFDRKGLDIDREIGAELLPRLDRLRALRSAWGVLAPSDLSDNGREIAGTGRTVTEYFTTLTRAQDQLDEPILAKLDARLDDFEATLRETASRVSIPQLRSTLPRYLSDDRRGLLDLLDVLIGGSIESGESIDGRIFSVDYLITLLCADHEVRNGTIRHDPTTLTPKLQSICRRADETNDRATKDVVAEFFAASNMNAEGLREEFQQRRLRSRKAELGCIFFHSSVLRAIVTYNVALFERATGEIIESGDWGFSEKGVAGTGNPTSLYMSKALKEIAAAVRRRAMGGNPEPTKTDRIAWALDFDYLEGAERRALQSERLGTRGDPLGTAILVGLICRSLAVLSIDLQDAGVSPDDVSEGWVAELTETFQTEINEKIAKNDYKLACALSELKDKFLFAPLEEHLREQRVASVPLERRAAPEPEASQEPTPKRESARELVRDALEDTLDPTERSAWIAAAIPRLPLSRVVPAAVAILTLIVGGLFLESRRDPDLDRWSRDELASVSRYLSRGKRNGAGIGPAFVGTIDDEWLALPSNQREASAEALVDRLRDLGVRQIMIYDDDHALRIQSLGSQPTRTL